MDNVLKNVYFGNSLYSWLTAIAIIVIFFILFKLISFFVIKKIKAWSLKTATTWDEFLIVLVEKSILPLLYISVFYFALSTLNFSEKVNKVIHVAYLISITFFILRIITAAFKKFIYSFIQRQENSESKERQAGGLIVIANVIIWILGMIFLIDNLGYNVTTLIAGLGVGGIAIALAAQAVLGDLFSYFVIFFDRPFEIGDFIIVEDKLGTVEYIGIKTTRIRSLSGEQLVFSNTDLTNSRVHNYKRMLTRRIVFSFGVPYTTSREKLAMIPDMVKKIILKEQEKGNATFDRAHLLNLGPSYFTYECVYIVLTGDYNKYMDVQQRINLEICEVFDKNGIRFAYPAQTVFVNQDPSTPAKGLSGEPSQY